LADTTLSASLEHIETVLTTSSGLGLTLSTDPWSAENVPGTLTNDTVRVRSGGQVGAPICQSNFASARLDRVLITVTRSLMDGGAYQAQRDILDVLDDIERAVIAASADHDYMVTIEKGSRKVVHPKDSTVCEAEIGLVVDYDFNEAA
jgi:hypothetical protein